MLLELIDELAEVAAQSRAHFFAVCISGAALGILFVAFAIFFLYHLYLLVVLWSLPDIPPEIPSRTRYLLTSSSR